MLQHQEGPGQVIYLSSIPMKIIGIQVLCGSKFKVIPFIERLIFLSLKQINTKIFFNIFNYSIQTKHNKETRNILLIMINEIKPRQLQVCSHLCRWKGCWFFKLWNFNI